MTKTADPALFESNFERVDGDRYWTEPWITEALVRHLPSFPSTGGAVWEPAAGRGDMASVLLKRGYEVFASDVDMSEFSGEHLLGQLLCTWAKLDFLTLPTDGIISRNMVAIITNPPYGDPKTDRNKAEIFLRRALEHDVRLVAMLMRSEFNSGKTRMDLFERPDYAFEIVLTSRPRWDWWFCEKSKHSGRHNFSWFVWDKAAEFSPSSTFFECRPDSAPPPRIRTRPEPRRRRRALDV